MLDGAVDLVNTGGELDLTPLNDLEDLGSVWLRINAETRTDFVWNGPVVGRVQVSARASLIN